MLIDLVLLIVLDMPAHHDYRLPHQEHKKTAAERETNDDETESHELGNARRLAAADELQYPVGPIAHNYALVSSKYGGKRHKKQPAEEVPPVLEKEWVQNTQVIHGAKVENGALPAH
jgi:hypothetical protein